MNIPEIGENFNSRFKGLLEHDEAYTLMLVCLVGAAAFGLGRASVEPSVENSIPLQVAAVGDVRAQGEVPEARAEERVVKEVKAGISSETAAESQLGMYVASKTGSKYHLPWCGGAKQIKEENKVWFQSKEEAEGAGYTPASNCKGI